MVHAHNFVKGLNHKVPLEWEEGWGLSMTATIKKSIYIINVVKTN